MKKRYKISLSCIGLLVVLFLWLLIPCTYAQIGNFYWMGTVVSQNPAKAAEWWRKAAEKGHPQAQYNLGSLYILGQGVPQDDSQAFAWFSKAAEHGYMYAQNDLANMYATGRGVPQDWDKADKLYSKAAHQGVDTAQCLIGLYYANGERYYPQSNIKAYKWIALSAAQGFPEAIRIKAQFDSHFSKEDIEEGQKLAAIWKPEKI